jgi:predicted Zn-dependent protease
MAELCLSGVTPWGGERVNEYVNRIGQNLARASDSDNVFTFRVLYSPELNARSFPGGYVLVNTGVISVAESEAELAAVLAHEIAHVNARHWQRFNRRRVFYGLLTFVPMMLGIGPAAMAIGYGSAEVAPLAEARFSRSFEREADRLTMNYLALAGYDPEAFTQLLEKQRALQLAFGNESRGLLSTHPSVASRQKSSAKVLKRTPVPSRALETTSEFESIQREIAAYDKVYAELVGGRLPSGEISPPKLKRRPPAP